MKAIIGKKIGMTRIFEADGRSIAVSVLEVKPCPITLIKTEEKDGYNAVQMGYGEAKHITKPLAGHLKKSASKAKYLKEFKNFDKKVSVGDAIDLTEFKEKDIVSVSAVSKGKGFAGVIKRHSFHRGPETHGSDHHRAPGSIGGRYPQRVPKGKRMAGRMGGERTTTKGLEIIKIIQDKNMLVLKGAVPGPNGVIVEIKG